MAWSYTQDFDGLTTADLNGQDSWSGDASYDVIDTGTILQGTKSVYSNSNAEVNITRTVTSASSGTISIMMRRTETTSLMLYCQMFEGVSYKFDFGMSHTGTIVFRGGTSHSAGSFSANTTYTIDCEYDCSTDQGRVRFDGGSWTAWAAFVTTATTIDKIQISKQNSGTNGVWFDAIQDGAAAAGPTTVKTKDGVTQSSGIKTYMGVAVASVKSVNGAT